MPATTRRDCLSIWSIALFRISRYDKWLSLRDRTTKRTVTLGLILRDTQVPMLQRLRTLNIITLHIHWKWKAAHKAEDKNSAKRGREGLVKRN